MAEEDYLKDLNEALERFQTYFPEKREDIDIIVLRGHQLAESLLYKFIKQNVRYPEYIDSFFIRWEPLVALVRAMKNEKTKEYDWVSLHNQTEPNRATSGDARPIPSVDMAS